VRWVSRKALLGWVLTVGALAVAAPAALSAVAGRYAGKTTQGQPVTFKLSGGAVHRLTIKINDRCPDGHTLIVTEHYPAMPVTHRKFGGSFVPKNGHPGENSRLTGTIGKHRVFGRLVDVGFSKRERAFCHGQTGWSAKHA
jgi:hypothetical protein